MGLFTARESPPPLQSRIPSRTSSPHKSNLHLTQDELVEIRALQRTFEGAYVRTALSQFSFALLVLKIFTHEFYSVGALYAGFGVCVFAVSLLRRREGNKQFFVEVEKDEGSGEAGRRDAERRFRTSGNVVCVVTGVSLCAYIALLVLVLKIGKSV
ncbi:hypothetical protein EV426DRAFT_285227 [Tirmania nivea]|nr:hypothetical protein EV426DRAFT_285227 [Tirmania nivea]